MRKPRRAAITGEWLGAEALVHLPPLRTPRRWRVAAWLARMRRALSARRMVVLLGATLATAGLGEAGYVHAKAGLAQVLLRQAWVRSLETRVAHKPWPWADTWPVARITVPRLAIDQIVLAGASGRTLAFGPALSTAAAVPGEPGNAIVSGHRDTHFRFLQDLHPGDRVWMETAGGRRAFEVERTDIVDARATALSTAAESPRLTLVTCYPFDALRAGGPLRYVVTARLLADGVAAL